MWSRNGQGDIVGVPKKVFPTDMVLYDKRLKVSSPPVENIEYKLIYEYGEFHLSIFIFEDGSNVDSNGELIPIEIKVRQRGTEPILLSAETNEAGDKVILTFDKKMSPYNGSDGSDTFKIRNGLADDDYNFTAAVIDDCLITIPYNVVYPEDPISVSVLLHCIESFDYGLLQPFENFPVTNNVVAPE